MNDPIAVTHEGKSTFVGILRKESATRITTMHGVASQPGIFVGEQPGRQGVLGCFLAISRTQTKSPLTMHHQRCPLPTFLTIDTSCVGLSCQVPSRIGDMALSTTSLFYTFPNCPFPRHKRIFKTRTPGNIWLMRPIPVPMNVQTSFEISGRLEIACILKPEPDAWPSRWQDQLP